MGQRSSLLIKYKFYLYFYLISILPQFMPPYRMVFVSICNTYSNYNRGLRPSLRSRVISFGGGFRNETQQNIGWRDPHGTRDRGAFRHLFLCRKFPDIRQKLHHCRILPAAVPRSNNGAWKERELREKLDAMEQNETSSELAES
jgi:hypothetical protein